MEDRVKRSNIYLSFISKAKERERDEGHYNKSREPKGFQAR